MNANPPTRTKATGRTTGAIIIYIHCDRLCSLPRGLCRQQCQRFHCDGGREHAQAKADAKHACTQCHETYAGTRQPTHDNDSSHAHLPQPSHRMHKECTHHKHQILLHHTLPFCKHWPAAMLTKRSHSLCHFPQGRESLQLCGMLLQFLCAAFRTFLCSACEASFTGVLLQRMASSKCGCIYI
jgi:hypothetical protein